ncbi:MAG: glycosyltransferase family 4 protein [Candidatus Binatia bacterium]
MARRILLLNERDPANPLAGGAEVHIFEIFGRLVKRGHEVTLLSASFKGSSREDRISGFRVRRLANRYLYYGMVPFAARREAMRGDYDVVVDVLNKLPFLSPWFVPVPCFAVVHHLFGTTAFQQASFPIALVTYLSEKLVPLAYRGVPMLAISPSTKDDLVERGLRPEQVWVVPPGLDHEAYVAGTELRGREPLILWIGRLEPYKRAGDMLEAMVRILDRVPRARLVVIGAGSAREGLERLVRDKGLQEAVEFAGFISEEDKIDYLQRAAVVVNTSEKEGWGMTVIEGNACGTPNVSTDVPGLRDSVKDGDTGLLFDCGDVGALTECLLRILTDEKLSERLSIKGLEWAARFSWDRVADDALTLLERAIEGDRGPVRLVASPFQD